MTNSEGSDIMSYMKVGDLLISKDYSGSSEPVVIVVGIRQHPENSTQDRILLQWIPKKGGISRKGEFSRFIVERKYRVA